MSFGLLTAVNLEDVPKVLQRCAHGWRGGVYRRYPQAWLAVADKVEQFALELNDEIKELKQKEPKRSRARVILD